MNDGYTLLKKLVAEGTGTAFLLAAVVGSRGCPQATCLWHFLRIRLRLGQRSSL